MPGINIAYNLAGALSKSSIEAALQTTLYFPTYAQETLQSTPYCFIGSVRYPDYPVKTFDNGNLQIVLEGRIYDKFPDQLNTELNEIAQHIFEPNAGTALSRWLMGVDGEFVITIFNKATNELAIFNDILGRLSLYYSATPQQILIARDIRFIVTLQGNRQFDRMGIAQYLLFGYPFAQRTLFENVDLLPPASLIRLSPHGIKREQIHIFNYDNKIHHQKSIQQNADAMASIFHEAVRVRTDADHVNVLSLSGGRDSRSIGAALHNLHIPFTTATFLDYYKSAKGDADLAEQAAQLWDAEWFLDQLAPTTGTEALKLLTIKSGLCGLRLCDILVFFEKIQQKYGDHVYYFTGDGGAKISDQRPARHLNNDDDLVQFVTSRHQRASLDTVADITGISKTDILDELHARFKTYPEKDTDQKHVHFMIHERAPKFAFESEDRNRCYFWSMSPIYSIHMFNYVMNCPDDQKANYALYSEFMSRLSPAAANLTEQNVGLPITSKHYRIKHGVKKMLMGIVSNSPTLVRYAKNFIGRTNPYAPGHLIMNCLRDQIQNSPSVATYLSPPKVRKVLDNFQQYSKEELQLLLTVASAIEEFSEPRTTLEKYADKHVI